MAKKIPFDRLRSMTKDRSIRRPHQPVGRVQEPRDKQAGEPPYSDE